MLVGGWIFGVRDRGGALLVLQAADRAVEGARQLAAEHGLGATHPDHEVAIIADALKKIRADVAPYNVPIPPIPEIEGPATGPSAKAA